MSDLGKAIASRRTFAIISHPDLPLKVTAIPALCQHAGSALDSNGSKRASLLHR
jgi:peptide subunit release factor RF-3